MFGLTMEKLAMIGVIAVFIVGPQRLPHYASQLARAVKAVKSGLGIAKDRLRDEMGPDFDSVDWKKLDPRQYDPRAIIRSALSDDEIAHMSAPTEPHFPDPFPSSEVRAAPVNESFGLRASPRPSQRAEGSTPEVTGGER